MKESEKPDKTARNGRPIVSDALGFGKHQLQDFERDRKENGFVGVSFREDKDVPGFYQVECSSRGVWDRYVRHRGNVDKNRTSGAAVSSQGILNAQEKMLADFERRKEQRRKLLGEIE